MSQTTTPTTKMAARSMDFDFLTGDWIVHHRRLAALLQESKEWREFTTTQHGGPLLGGLANYDELTDVKDGTLLGLSFRSFNLDTQKWHIHWVATRDGVLQPAVIGSFNDQGEGEFHGDDTLDGKPIRVRYSWTGTRTATPRWSQAFSSDGGNTWETNWVMEFSRPAH